MTHEWRHCYYIIKIVTKLTWRFWWCKNIKAENP